MKKLLGLALVSALFSGCASVNHMAFEHNAKSIDTSAKSVILMTLDVSRLEESHFSLKPNWIIFDKSNAEGKNEPERFVINKADDAIPVAGHDIYLVRMAIKPGHYLLKEIDGKSLGFPFFASFAIPLRLNVNIQPNTVTYIGRVSATLRPKNDGEFRAGPLLPLVDQAITGLSTGTWDVVVADKSQQDMPLFQSNYPVVIDATIDNKILPPFNRAAVQAWSDLPYMMQ